MENNMSIHKVFFLSVFSFLLCGCFQIVRTQNPANSDYIFISKPIDLHKPIKQGKICATSPQTNKEMIFTAARKADINEQIVLIEKTEEGGQYCTVVYGN